MVRRHQAAKPTGVRGDALPVRVNPPVTERASGSYPSASSQRSKVRPEEAAVRRGWVRFDRPGHIDDRHAQRLLRLSGKRPRPDADFAFVPEHAADEAAFGYAHAPDDELAIELAEHAISAMGASGESLIDVFDAAVEEDDGGPFLETRASQEFALGEDESTDGFYREALPTSGADPGAMMGPWTLRVTKRKS